MNAIDDGCSDACWVSSLDLILEMRWFLLHPEWVITRERVGEGAHFPGRCLGVQTWHTNAQIMDIIGFYGSDHGSRPWMVLVFSCLMESPAAMQGDPRACLLCPSRWVAPLSLSSAALE